MLKCTTEKGEDGDGEGSVKQSTEHCNTGYGRGSLKEIKDGALKSFIKGKQTTQQKRENTLEKHQTTLKPIESRYVPPMHAPYTTQKQSKRRRTRDTTKSKMQQQLAFTQMAFNFAVWTSLPQHCAQMSKIVQVTLDSKWDQTMY